MKKNMFLLLMLLPVMILITGCPTGVAYPLGKPGSEKIDKQLLGTWIQPDANREVKKVSIVKIDDYSVKVTVLERGDLYSEEIDNFIGWTTTIEGKDFLYLQEFGNTAGQYYTYCFAVKDKTLITYDISLKVDGVDGVTSTEAYREEVKVSLTLPDALTSETTWTKQ